MTEAADTIFVVLVIDLVARGIVARTVGHDDLGLGQLGDIRGLWLEIVGIVVEFTMDVTSTSSPPSSAASEPH